MSHDYHEGLPGYSERQIFHDGCPECEDRAKRDDHGLSSLDRRRFYQAWARSAEWNWTDLPGISRAERPLLSMLWSLQLKLQSYAGVPIGVVPSGQHGMTDAEAI